MYVKEITYPDFDGNMRTEKFCFHMMQSEVVEMQASRDGGFDKFLEKIINTQDQNELIKLFKKLILMSYGERSEDGRGFRKSPELAEAFSQTEAFSQLFMELAQNADEAQKFIEGVFPKVPQDKLPAKAKTATK